MLTSPPPKKTAGTSFAVIGRSGNGLRARLHVYREPRALSLASILRPRRESHLTDARRQPAPCRATVSCIGECGLLNIAEHHQPNFSREKVGSKTGMNWANQKTAEDQESVADLAGHQPNHSRPTPDLLSTYLPSYSRPNSRPNSDLLPTYSRRIPNHGHKIGGISGLEPGTAWLRVEHSAVVPLNPTTSA
ncbi:hypothetical protein Bbelb_192140 [Branchiostoma belcheri]|nr:hypothetical protein Bbelb_192140 [Branchiostoma belcheri]